MPKLFGSRDKITEAKEIKTLILGDLQGTVLGGGGATHNLLSITHSDAATQGVSRGSIIYGDSTPVWNELTLGGAGTHLESDNTDISWVEDLTLGDGHWVGLGAAAARVEFSSSGNAVSLYSAADLIVYSDAGSTEVARIDGATGNITTSGTVDGVDVANFNAAQFVVIAATTYCANEQVLESYAPTWTAAHIHQNTVSFDDGTGDSPALQFIGGSNNDTALIFLDDDATATDSNLVIKLCDSSGDSELIIQQADGTPMVAIDTYGNAIFGGSSPATQLHIIDTAITNLDYSINRTVVFEDEECVLQMFGQDDTTANVHIVMSAAPASGDNKHWILSHLGPAASNRFSIGYKTSSTSNWNEYEPAEFFVIETGGFVGMGGVTDPTVPLHVYESSATTDAIVDIAQLEAYSTGDITDGFGPTLLFRLGDSGAQTTVGRIHCARDGADNSGALSFGVKSAGSWISDAIWIDRQGYVGIGVTNPSSMLAIDLSTANLEIVDAGRTDATEQDWIQVEVGGNTGYIRVFDSK